MDSIKIKKGQSIIFSDDDMEMISVIAQEKIDAKLRSGLSISNYGFQGTPLEKEAMSIGSEIAFARMIGIQDPTMRELINNNWYDFKIGDVTIDVKATKTTRKSISIPVEKAFKKHADIFVLMMQFHFCNFEFVGSIHKDDLIQANNIVRLDYWKHDTYKSSNLKDLELCHMIEKKI